MKKEPKEKTIKKAEEGKMNLAVEKELTEREMEEYILRRGYPYNTYVILKRKFF